MPKLVRASIAVLTSIALWVAVPTAARAADPVPAPPASLSSNVIDAHPGYQPQTTCSPSAKPGATALLNLLITTWGGSSSGISRACTTGGTSEHKEGRALDWHMDVKNASDVAQVDKALTWITANNGEIARRLGIMYIIWNQQLWATYAPDRGWRNEADRGSYTANHKDHVHISLTWDGAYQQTSWWTGVPVTVPLEGACGGTGQPGCLPVIPRSTDKTWPYQETFVPAKFVAAPKAVPIITGTAQIGRTLQATTGNWATGNAKLSYQWQANGTSIEGADQASLEIAPSLGGKTLRVQITAKPSSGSATTRTSAATAKVSLAKFSTGAAGISGVFSPGKTLTAGVSSWTPEPEKVSYQWLRDGKKISGATKATYKVKSSDNKHQLSVKITGASTGYQTTTLTSAKTTVLRQFTSAPIPQVRGSLVAGATLSVITGTWSPKPSKLTYQWYADGVAIAKATKATVVLPSDLVGKTITVKVTAAKSGYRTIKVYSEPTAVVSSSGLSASATPDPAVVPSSSPAAWAPTAEANPSPLAAA
ncbi:hypothetical protein ATK74_2846 [Propionicimonas paludicola]|uniref:ARB-07466-like C-terminal domain-containing protein n=1 Tax=Propionicimonas paludicola TaxID=185243 RepID=A0A2A9CX70_9ACTN|nr:hypothetical protein [Propionicimonas paludicola]PFG18262.1 hypothetical protein ATK74_2846 [Propionicimonas paludicola]